MKKFIFLFLGCVFLVGCTSGKPAFTTTVKYYEEGRRTRTSITIRYGRGGSGNSVTTKLKTPQEIKNYRMQVQELLHALDAAEKAMIENEQG